MNHEAVILVLAVAMAVLFLIVLYQQYIFRRGIREKLQEINGQLREIIETDSSKQVMIFTENQELMELAAQINALLEKQADTKADYRRMELSSKKMLSNISHDIKTPMTVVLGYLEMMRLKEDVSKDMVAKVEQKAKSVMELIDQFFTLSKIESGDMELGLSKIDICEICRESILDFYELLSDKAFEVEVGIPDEAVWIQGNREALQRILFNLISNAVRYGAEGAYLGIFVRCEERNVYVDVEDKGRGIEKAFADSIFDRLFTMEDSRNRRIQGNGLGLAIAKNLAKRLGGTITLESIPHVKTVFTVKLNKSVI